MEICVGQLAITVGLVFDIIGVIFLFFAGSRRSQQIGKLWGEKVDKIMGTARKRDNIGICFLVTGFALQILGNHIP